MSNKIRKILFIGSVSETQTISKNAQLSGYEGELTAGMRYTYDGASWTAAPQV